MHRHDLAYLHPGSALAFPCRQPDARTQALIHAWIGQGRPLVVARQPEPAPALPEGGSSGQIWLGLTLPAHADRQRISCQVAPEAIRRFAPPLPLAACLHRLPAATAAPLAQLVNALDALGLCPRSYGSLAWEAMSGEDYRHPASDVDLILDLADRSQALAVLPLLAQTNAALPCRLDGELRLPDGQAVAWRELADALARPSSGTDTPVLLKGDRSVALVPVQTWLDSFRPVHQHPEETFDA